MLLKNLLLDKIWKNLNNVKYIKITDITYQHANHLPSGTNETHFKITIVSDVFCDLSLIERQRMIYELFKFELTHKIHALSLLLYTTNEFKNK
ncbi:MAG: BolA family transcriptional regulator [Rickettsiaceae bacterium H1]|nr:BolA family transcriptional regulator [Rickettsiaceae bacterium H1]